jgi:glycine/D-amino acid oxidase-like deaminating enzyme
MLYNHKRAALTNRNALVLAIGELAELADKTSRSTAVQREVAAHGNTGGAAAPYLRQQAYPYELSRVGLSATAPMAELALRASLSECEFVQDGTVKVLTARRTDVWDIEQMSAPEAAHAAAALPKLASAVLCIETAQTPDVLATGQLKSCGKSDGQHANP